MSMWVYLFQVCVCVSQGIGLSYSKKGDVIVKGKFFQ